MAPSGLAARALSALVLGLLVPLVVAHGGDDAMDMGMDMSGAPKNATGHGADEPKDASEYPPTYFAHPEHTGVIYAHIVLMVVSWVFVLPLAVMFSIAKSRFTLLLQFVFLGANAFGVLLATIYNAQTPDLYPNNAHHKIGWLVTMVVSAHVFVSAVGRVAGAMSQGFGRTNAGSDSRAFLPIPTSPLGPHHNDYRCSNDSGQGTEPNTPSLRSSSVSSSVGLGLGSPEDRNKEYGDEDLDGEDEEDLEALSFTAPRKQGLLSRYTTSFVSSRLWKYVRIAYNCTDRIILPFGFIALATGLVAFARFFEGQKIFSGLAHWIKGGVFFWLGLFTLGRWTGSFGDLGWAWNLKATQSRGVSAEFVESFLIFFYGCTNIFLEHLGNWGGEWSAQDLEHISITVLFIGGGLCGMLVESSRIRDVLNVTVTDAQPARNQSTEEAERHEPPSTYQISLNPIPALVILLLGIMMSSHTQHSMTSSMIHKQWGDLLTAASISRVLTYALVYLKPPKSVFPSRPPTELLTSFGLIAGGLIFMASSSDTVEGMIHYNLNAMVMYTVILGLVGLLMAWEIIVLAIKGWAVRRERRYAMHLSHQ